MSRPPSTPPLEILAAFQEVSDDIFFVAHPDTAALEYVSPGCERYLGRSPEELLADPESLAWAVFPDGASRPAQGAFETEHRFVRPDGEVRWLRARSYPVQTEASDGTRIVGLIRDVTEQKLAAGALRRSREEILQIVERIPDGILVATADRVEYVNQSLADSLGYRHPSELVGIAPTALIHPDDRGLGADRLAAALMDQGVPPRTELRVRHRSGEWKTLGFTHVRVIQYQGASAELALVQDLTAARAQETARREAESRYRTLFQHAPLGIALITASGEMVGANPALLRLLGIPRITPGVSGFDLIHPEDQEVAREQFDAMVAGEIPGYHRDTRLRRADGGFTPVRIHISASRAFEGDEPLMISLVEDISERVTLEQQLRTIARIESIGRLAGGIAHDFNNLVTVINGHTEMILEETPRGDPLRQDLEDILQAGRRAAALTGQLLAFSRRTVQQTRILDLNEVLEGLRSLLLRTLGEDVELRVSLNPLQHRIVADQSQLEQIVLNLVVNARDAMPTGGVLTVSTDERKLDEEFVEAHPGSTPGEYVCLTVADTGEGMTKDLLDYIFEPFFTTKPPGEGTGLGLATVYGIVKQSMGYIQVESEPGLGTTFHIYFPATSSTTREEPPRPGKISGGSETVLLVEDDEAVRSLAERVLSLQGYHVITASDGREGLERVEEGLEKVDLLVTDVIMPGIGGRELAERLTNRRPELPVLFISGYTDDALLRHGIREGEVRMLYKPFSAGEFARAVRDALDHTPTRIPRG